MCGIVGYIGKKNSLPILIKGLKRLEYRGYDSAGIAYLKDKTIKITKTTGRIKQLEQKIENKDYSNIGIGHTRWATHGGVTVTNSHPHQVENITIVHNGIIENYQEIKQDLIKEGYSFKSDTDTEVACAYINYLYKKSKTKGIKEILNNCIEKFQGSYAISIIIEEIPDKLFVLKKDSPLIIATSESGNYIASDISAYIDEASKYVILEDMQIGIITQNDIEIYENGKKIKPKFHDITSNYTTNEKGQYEHYMQKEIAEQKELIANENSLYLEHLEKIPDITKYTKIHIIGCGTAYHAGMIGKYLIEKYNDFEVNVYIASEYRYQKIFYDKNTLVIAASQSGETADTLACLKKAKENNCTTIGIVNVENSSIARIVDEVIYTKAGPEVAVASTKAYTSQVYIFSLLALKIALTKQLISLEEITKQYQTLPKLIEKLLNLDYSDIIKHFWNDKDIFYLGRNIDYVSVLEGSLKLKEISYIHSEAYQAGELKHGTISLIEKGTCVISLITDDKTASKTISNIKEVKARGAYIILLIKKSINQNIDNSCYDKLIVIDDIHPLVQPILNVIPLQLIAYNVAKKRGCDIDKPRNLAKSVTVE